jgi:hypothetical protein
MFDPIGPIGGLLALAVGVGLAAAARVFGLRSLRFAVAELGITLTLARSIDGRHALSLAWGLRRAARRLRGTLTAVQDDTARRGEVLATLEHFTGRELSILLRRMHTLIATGDNDRIRALNRQLDTYSAQWANLADGPERRRLDAAMAQVRQQMEESRRTSRAWVGLIRKLEETGSALKTLERDLAVAGIDHHSPLPDFRRRLDEISAHIQHVQQARRELEAAR